MTADRRALDDCFLHDSDRLRHEECIERITGQLGPVVPTLRQPLERAHGHYLAETITAGRDVPLHTNSAVDGFAFAHADLAAGPRPLPVAGRIAAGDRAPPPLRAGTAVRIFTGAILPEGADTVAMQEDCALAEDGRTVTLPEKLGAGANVRRAGEDVKAGEVVLSPGTLLRPQDIAAIASLGHAEIGIFAPLRLGLLSSGNELVEPGRALREGEVFDSNRLMLAALASTLPATVTDCGVLPDRGDDVRSRLSEAAARNDLVIATGGASRGEEDHMVRAIDQLGTLHFWQIAVKPGRPMAMGRIGDCVVIGLPGNPVAAFVCFVLYCRPAMTVLGGGEWREPARFMVPAGFSIAGKKAGRREFWRGWLETDRDGRTVVRKFGRDGSGLISGLRKATGLIEVPEAVTRISEGDPVSFIPFESLGIMQ